MSYNNKNRKPIEFDKFKTEIDLAKFMESYGYRVDPKFCEGNGANRRIAMRKGETVYMVRINSNNNQYIYTEKYGNALKSGSIVDFLQSEQNLSFGEIAKTLRAYLNEPQVSFDNKEFDLKIQKAKAPKTINTSLFEFSELYDTTYLESRGFDPEFLKSSQFKGRIGNKLHTDEKGKKHLNTVFPIYNKEGIQGLEVKNEGFKGALQGSNKGEALWFSNMPKDKDHLQFFISESTIDCIAHAQLNQDKAKNILYIANNGNMTSGHVQLVQELIDKHKPHSILMGMDNDVAGERFYASFLGQLETPNSDHRIQFKINKVGKSLNQLIVTTHDKELSKMIDYHIKTINNKRELTSKNEFQFRAQGTFKNELGYTSKFTFYNFTENVQQALELIEFSKNHKNIQRVKPVSKDYTRDLEISKGINIQPKIKKTIQNDIGFEM